ncbi:PAS domain S-box-containing protein [Flavobacterium nitrogenifigens]|uniref:histidine kinase n=2 Tax=Flavobacterium TaxID=237 RepID=A0A7W7IVZ0_9FLAO|nr:MULTISPECIES: PAS domain S-box protein [Flavobacterium]MBB4801591.1 PAS domain S-box-containing protein [Flavobacterium nitrogenifigens]MBB6386549.1 PAS domain S-box-containing protein [Flavobacterium notoginsengisoli]
MELLNNLNLFETVFNAAPNGIAVLKPLYNSKNSIQDFSILLLNSAMISWVKDANYKNKKYSEVFPWIKKDILEKLIETVETGTSFHYEQWHEIDETKKWFLYTAVKQDDLLVLTTEDITEKKQAETALNNALTVAEKQKRLYDSIINTTPDLVYVFDLDYIFTYANKALLNMWGKSAEDAIGKGLRENGYEEWHAEMHEREIDEVVSTKKSIRGTVSFPHAELGRRIYDYIFAPVFNEKGDVEAIAGTTRDITEIKQAEGKLQLSESRFRKMIHQTPAPTLILKGDDLVIEQINNHMLQMIGRGEEIIGMRLIDVLPELEGQYVWEQVLNVYNKGIPFDQSEVLVPHNRTGELKNYYYNLAYRPLLEEGQITGMIQVAVEVTEQVVARQKMEESENRFRALVNASSDLVYRMDSDWMIMHDLEGAGALSNSKEPVVNWLDKFIHANDLQRAVNLISQSIIDKSIFEMEHRVTNPDGSIGWVFSRVVPILDENDKIVEWFGTASDITSQKELQEVIKESEEKFRQLADLVPQIIWTARPDGFIDYYNSRWYEYTGLNEDIFGDSSWVPVVHPNDVDLVKEFWYYSVENGNAYQLEFRIKNIYTNEYRWFLSKAVPIKDKSGVITNWFGTCTDIHEQKSTTEKLEILVADRTKELQRSNDDLQQFAHVASHDLKEPVRKIKTFVSRLEDHLEGKLDESSTRFIERIHVAADRMFNMIDGVLAYSKINADSQKTTLVDLNEIIRNIETDLEIALQKSNGKILYQNLPKLEGASVLLYQLFYNLINNSIKFAQETIPPVITISAEIINEQDKKMARINLEDNGIGFASNQTNHIFETFTRLNPKDRYEGTGLGLSLCKKIAERHGGSISASGIPNQGAIFIIKLPLEQKENDI